MGDISADLLSKGISILSQKCPQEDNMELFRRLDESGILNNSFINSADFHTAHFLMEIFEGISNEDVIQQLYTSKCWDDIPRTEIMKNELTYGVINREENGTIDGKRFIHILKIGNDVGSAPDMSA